MTLRLAIVIMTLSAVLLPTTRQADDAKSFWEKMIAAKGGRDRLHAITTLVRARDGSQRRAIDPGRQVGEVHETSVYQFPNKYWDWVDTRPSRHDAFSVSVFNGELRQWWYGSSGNKAKVQPWDSGNLIAILANDQLHYLLETRFVKPTPTHLTVDAKRGQATLMATAPGFARIEYTVDLATYLPIECTTSWWDLLPGATAPTEGQRFSTYFEEYQVVDGVQMAKRIRGERSEVGFIINPDIDPKLFEIPPDGVTSRDEWKKYLRK